MKREASDWINFADEAYMDSWESRCKAIELEEFFNGERIPSNGNCDEPPPPINLGGRLMKRPFDQMLQAALPLDGFLFARGRCPSKVGAPLDVEYAATESANDVLADEYEGRMREMTGANVLTGRKMWYCTHPNSLKYNVGHGLFQKGAPADILDDRCWRWCFYGEYVLRDIDMFLDNSKKKGSAYNREGLEQLKKNVLEAKWNGKKKSDHKDYRFASDNDIDAKFPASWEDDAMDVIFCYEKSETKGKDDPRYRKIHFTVVARYGIDFEEYSEENVKGVDIKPRKGQEDQVIFHKENFFDSPHGATIPIITDSRISGEQLMDQVRGEGHGAFAKLVMNEQMARMVMENVLWGATPKFQVNTRRAGEWLQSHGDDLSQPYAAFPNGLDVVNTSSSTGSIGQTLGVMQGFGLSAEQDVATGDVPASLGRISDPDRKATADQQAASIQQTVAYRVGKYLQQLDKLVRELGKRLTGDVTGPDKAYIEMFQKTLEECHGFTIDEVNEAKLKWQMRRIPGAAHKQEAIANAQFVLSNATTPEIAQMAQRQMISAIYGEAEARRLFPENPEIDEVQSIVSQAQIAYSLATGIPAAQNESDDFSFHTQDNLQTFAAQIQIHTQAGKIHPDDLMKIQGLMQHTEADISRIPPQFQEQGVQAYQQLQQELAKIPVSQDADQQKDQLEMAKMQSEIQKNQSSVANIQDLVRSRNSGDSRKDTDHSMSQIKDAYKEARAEEAAATDKNMKDAAATKIKLETAKELAKLTQGQLPDDE